MPSYGRGQHAPKCPKTCSCPPGGLTLTLTWRGCSPGMLMALPWCSDVRTRSCSGGMHRATSSAGLPSPPAWSCGYCWYERPINNVLPRAFVQCFSNRRKFAQLVGSDFNRIINHCCFFIPIHSCQVSRPLVPYPFWALATYKSTENLC